MLRSVSLAKLPVFARWGVLVALSVLFAALLSRARLPAALLLGPMIAGILVENAGAGIVVPKLPFGFAQAVVGCMIARVLTPAIIHSFLHQWPLFLGVSFLVIFVSCLLGWAISKFRILPETTAIWGLLPGAASAMMVMADAYGADARLVAFMQYVRVVLVALVASLVARLWVHAPAVAAAAPAAWFAPIHALPFIETLVLVLAAVMLGPVSRIPAGTLLIPMFAGAVLQSNGLVAIELPRWLLAASYCLLGWTIGLRFTRAILVYTVRALPKMMLSILILIAFCGGFAVILVEVFGIDPLTAYLATSPGGADSVAIIAASTNVDIGFVMAQQIARFILVLIVGPTLSRFVADRIAGDIRPAETRPLQ
jgi:membrane AbrB-like protein